jgi:hypothetical protein
MMAWIGRRLRLAVRTVIRAVRAVPTTATGPLRWVPSLDGNRLVGSYLPT